MPMAASRRISTPSQFFDADNEQMIPEYKCSTREKFHLHTFKGQESSYHCPVFLRQGNGNYRVNFSLQQQLAEEKCEEAEAIERELEKQFVTSQVASLGEGVSLEAGLLSSTRLRVLCDGLLLEHTWLQFTGRELLYGEVKLIDFSPGEKCLVTYNSHEPSIFLLSAVFVYNAVRNVALPNDFTDHYSQLFELSFLNQINDLKLESSSVRYWDIFSVTDEIATTYDKRRSKLLKPISKGHGVLTAYLNYYSGSKEGLEVLKVVQEVTICSKLEFNFREKDKSIQIIRLPWVLGVHQEVELRATRGCARTLEDYTWFSSDETVVCVHAYGLLKTRSPGRAVNKVASIFDPINYDEVFSTQKIAMFEKNGGMQSLIQYPGLQIQSLKKLRKVKGKKLLCQPKKKSKLKKNLKPSSIYIK